MWLVATFAQTSLFTLKSSHATSSGGKSNLLPTMYSFKMALIDAAFRAGFDGEEIFAETKNRTVAFRPPKKIVVNNSFIKVLREPKTPVAGQPYTSSVGYREFLYYNSDFQVALDVTEMNKEQQNRLERLLWHVNYLGKRGCFVQLKSTEYTDSLASHYSREMNSEDKIFFPDLMVQFLDDFGEHTKFQNINSFSMEKAKLGRDRVIKPVLLPLKQISSSRGYTLFQKE